MILLRKILSHGDLQSKCTESQNLYSRRVGKMSLVPKLNKLRQESGTLKADKTGSSYHKDLIMCVQCRKIWESTGSSSRERSLSQRLCLDKISHCG